VVIPLRPGITVIDLRFISSLLPQISLKKHSFEIVATVQYHQCERETRKPMEPAAGIELATCGLRISSKPTSDNLIPQETTQPDAHDIGLDGAELSLSW
jgi:hypothetical protein